MSAKNKEIVEKVNAVPTLGTRPRRGLMPTTLGINRRISSLRLHVLEGTRT
jgi:hypothetical protein